MQCWYIFSICVLFCKLSQHVCLCLCGAVYLRKLITIHARRLLYFVIYDVHISLYQGELLIPLWLPVFCLKHRADGLPLKRWNQIIWTVWSRAVLVESLEANVNVIRPGIHLPHWEAVEVSWLETQVSRGGALERNLCDIWPTTKPWFSQSSFETFHSSYLW